MCYTDCGHPTVGGRALEGEGARKSDDGDYKLVFDSSPIVAFHCLRLVRCEETISASSVDHLLHLFRDWRMMMRLGSFKLAAKICNASLVPYRTRSAISG